MTEAMENKATTDPKVIEMTIRVTPDGNINVFGPIKDLVLTMDILAGAMKSIVAFHLKERQGRIVKPQFIAPNDLKKVR